MYKWDEHNWTEIVETCNENIQQNSEIFDYSQLLNFDHNIGMFTSKWSYWWEEFNQIRVFEILVTVFLQLLKMKKNKNFWNLSYPVFTTTQNDEKLHISDSNSLVILSIWTYHTWRDMYRWDECNWTEIVENCNENMQ